MLLSRHLAGGQTLLPRRGKDKIGGFLGLLVCSQGASQGIKDQKPKASGLGLCQYWNCGPRLISAQVLELQPLPTRMNHGQTRSAAHSKPSTTLGIAEHLPGDTGRISH